LVNVQQRGYPVRIADAIVRKRKQGIWLSDRLLVQVLEQAK